MDTLSTQEVHPNKASLRTFIQTLIPALVTLVAVVPQIVEIILDEVGKANVALPGWLYVTLTGASVACAVVAAIVARVMAVPGVEDKLKKIGIGTKPKEIDETPPPEGYTPAH